MIPCLRVAHSATIMSPMHINQRDGAITFPNGIEIAASLTQDAFRAAPALPGARSQDYGTPPRWAKRAHTSTPRRTSFG